MTGHQLSHTAYHLAKPTRPWRGLRARGSPPPGADATSRRSSTPHQPCAQPQSISPGQTHEALAGTEGTGVPSSGGGCDITTQLHPSPAPRPRSRAWASPGADVTSRRSSTPHQPRAHGLVLRPPAGTQESTSRHCWAAANVTGDAREAPVSDLHK